MWRGRYPASQFGGPILIDHDHDHDYEKEFSRGNIAEMGDALQFVAFRIGAQQFVVEIHRVIEVISLCEITPLPGAPSMMEGIIDLRGQILPVIDMRKRLGISGIQNTMQTRVLIVRAGRQKMGLIVDEADQVYTIPLENIQAPPEQGSEFVLAVARHQNTLFIILEMERILTSEEQLHLQGINLLENSSNVSENRSL